MVGTKKRSKNSRAAQAPPASSSCECVKLQESFYAFCCQRLLKKDTTYYSILKAVMMEINEHDKMVTNLFDQLENILLLL